MSAPRPVIPGQTVMVTRRCTQRQFLLLPSQIINTILGFCLAIAAARYGVTVHAFAFLSNHVHLVLTDVHGELPEFCRWFFEFTAKCVNSHRGRWENLWSAERPSVVALADADAELTRTVYTITNAVEANLVSSASHWPGLVSLPKDVGRVLEFERPVGFFRPNGPLPEKATLKLEPLPSYAHLQREAYVELVGKAISEREEELAKKRRAEKKRVLGRRAVLRQSPFGRPKSAEPRRKLSPRVATRNKWARIEALQRLKGFLESYRDAWRRWQQGEKDVLFPYGTYALRRYAGVRCLGPP